MIATKRVLRLVLLNCLVLVLCLVACELAATAAKLIFDAHQKHQADSQIAQFGVADPNDRAGFLKEQDRAFTLTWTSYSYWRRAAVSGKSVNVDANGIRKTWNPEPLAKAPVRVFMFGGSTMWGTGSRDEYTLPSQLSKTLARSFGSAVEVVNFGESGYVQTQELISLLKEIQRGNVPNVAVFYDGYNDVFSAFQNRIAGIPQNERNRVREFNLLQFGPRFYEEWVRQTNLFWLVSLLADRVGNMSYFHHASMQKAAVSTQETASSPQDKDGRLIGDLLGIYAANVRVLKTLGREYNIKTLYYWQPSVFTKAARSPEERTLSDGDPFWIFHRAAMARLKDSPIEKTDSFRDLTGAFENHPERIFIDKMHVSESGNERLAGLIAPDVAEAIRQVLQEQSGARPAARPQSLR